MASQPLEWLRDNYSSQAEEDEQKKQRIQKPLVLMLGGDVAPPYHADNDGQASDRLQNLQEVIGMGAQIRSLYYS